jgi:predicted DNA-binding protein (UPF0251 family)
MPLPPADNVSIQTLQELLQRLLQEAPPIALQLVQPAYVDEDGAATYVNLSRNTFREHVKNGVFKRGTRLKPGGKYIYKISDLDFAIAKAGLSRKPKPTPRGIVRHRMEAKRRKVATALAAKADQRKTKTN